MYTCQNCGQHPEQVKYVSYKPVRVVTETRAVIYSTGSQGTEIVKEKDLCPKCASKFVSTSN